MGVDPDGLQENDALRALERPRARFVCSRAAALVSSRANRISFER